MPQQVGIFGPQPRIFVDDETGKIAYYPELYGVQASGELFDHLQRTMAWTQESMWMYDHTVRVPRLIARAEMTNLPPALAEMHHRVEQFLNQPFNAISLQYYRDGCDSVAWHSDHTEELIDRGIVALVSLGAVRDMQIRSKSKPRQTFVCPLDPGSLLVMAGRAQEFWQHHIPKVHRPIGPRMSIALRQRRHSPSTGSGQAIP